MLIKTFYPPRPFSKPCCGPGLSPLPPSHHNHTCLILSNLSFILANQLQRCTLFPPLAFLWFTYTLSYSSPKSPALTLYSLFFLHLYLVLFSPCHGIRVNLDPSKRQGSNKSVSGCTLPQGSKTVSKFPCLALLSCLPVPPISCLPAHTGICSSSEMPDVFSYCLSACLVNGLHSVQVPHTCFQAWLQSRKNQVSSSIKTIH